MTALRCCSVKQSFNNFLSCISIPQARQKDFFARAGSMSLTEREEEYAKIRKDHLKAVEESKEKIQIAEESYGLVDR